MRDWRGTGEGREGLVRDCGRTVEEPRGTGEGLVRDWRGLD